MTGKFTLLRGALKMHKSMLTAIDRAGGSGASFQWELLDKMTAKDLLIELGPNRIRFIYRKPKRVARNNFA